MDKKVFAKGIQLINSFLNEEDSIQKEQLDTYYLILKDSYLVEEYFFKSILLLCKEFKFEYKKAPSPATILEYYSKYIELTKPISYKVFEQILLEIKMYHQTPKYNQKVLKALDFIGGINVLRQATDREIRELRNKFIFAYEKQNKNNLIK